MKEGVAGGRGRGGGGRVTGDWEPRGCVGLDPSEDHGSWGSKIAMRVIITQETVNISHSLSLISISLTCTIALFRPLQPLVFIRPNPLSLNWSGSSCKAAGAGQPAAAAFSSSTSTSLLFFYFFSVMRSVLFVAFDGPLLLSGSTSGPVHILFS